MLFPWKQLVVWVLHIVVLTNLPPGCIGKEYVYTTANCRINESLTNSDADTLLRLQYDGNSLHPVTCSWNVHFLEERTAFTWVAQFIHLGVFSTCGSNDLTITIDSGDTNPDVHHICSTNRPLVFTGNHGDTLIVEYNALIPHPWDTFQLSYRRLSNYDGLITCDETFRMCLQSTDDKSKYQQMLKSIIHRNAVCLCQFVTSSKELPFLAFQILKNTYRGSCDITYITLTNDNDLNVRVCPGDKTAVIYGRSPVRVTITDPDVFSIGKLDILYRAVSFWSDEQVIDVSNAGREMQTLTLQTPAGYDRALDITWLTQRKVHNFWGYGTVTVLNVTYFRSQSDAYQCSDSSLRLSESSSFLNGEPQGENALDVCKATPHIPIVYQDLNDMTYRTNHSTGTYEFSLSYFRFYSDFQFCAADSIFIDVTAENKTIYGIKMTVDVRDMLCRYTLNNRDHGANVEVTVTYLSLGMPGEDCGTNYLKFYENVHDPPVEHRCPGSEIFSFAFRDRYLHIEMAKANPRLGNGFSMTFKKQLVMLDCSDSPKIVALGIQDEYNIYYPPDMLNTSRNIHCTWIFQSIHDQITLTVPNVIVEQYDCGEANIEVRDGQSAHDQLLANICRNSMKRVFISSRHYLHVELFIMARVESQPKVSLQLNATVGEVCKEYTEISITDSSRISFTVPQYYGSSGTCQWKITSRRHIPVGSVAIVQMIYKFSAHDSCGLLEKFLSVYDDSTESSLNTGNCDVYQSKGDVLFMTLHLGQLQPVYNAKLITMDLSTVLIPCTGNKIYEVDASKIIHVNVKEFSKIECTWVFRRSQVDVAGFLVANVSYEYTIRNGDTDDCNHNAINIFDGESITNTLIRQHCFTYDIFQAYEFAKGSFRIGSSGDFLMLQLLWHAKNDAISLVITVSSIKDSGTNTALVVSLISLSIVVILTIGMCLIYRRCIQKRPQRPPVQSSLHNMDEVLRVEDIDQEPAHTEQSAMPQSDAPPSYEDSQVQTTTFTTDPALPSYKSLFPDTETYI